MKKRLMFLTFLLSFCAAFCLEKQICFEEFFRESKLYSLKGKERERYRKKYGKKARIPGPLAIPSGWTCSRDAFEKSAKTEQKKTSFLLSSKTPVILASPLFLNRFGSYEILLSVSGKGNVTAEFYCPPEKGAKTEHLPAVSKKLTGGKTETLHLKSRSYLPVPRFQIRICGEGELELKNLILYEYPNPEIRIAEGTVLARSALPDLKSFGYPDSNYTIHFRGERLLSGKTCSRELQLVVPGFANSKMLPSSRLKKGDRIRVVLFPPSSLTEKERRVNQADDLTLFHLDLYHARHVSIIRNFSSGKNSLIPFKEIDSRYQSVFSLQLNPPIPRELVYAQKDAIRMEQAKMASLLAWEREDTALWSKKFQALWTKEWKKDPPGKNRPAKNLVWRNTGKSFWTLPLQFNPMGNQSITSHWNMNAILAFRDMLEANGVQLIVQIMPDCYDMAARAIIPEFSTVPDYRCARIVKQFLDAGIETYYTSGLLMENRDRYPFMFLYPSDAHPGDTCQEICTKQMSDVLSRYHFPKNLKKENFKSEIVPCSRKWPANCDIGENVPGTPLSVHQITMNGRPIPSDRKSPLLFIGNSFFTTPMKGASYANYMAWHGLCTSHYATLAWQGPFTTIFRNIFMDPASYLKGKKVVVIPVGVTSMQNAITWYDVREMDRAKKLLAGKKLKRTIELKSPLKQEKAISFRQKMSAAARKAWEENTDRKEFLLTKKKKLILANIPLNVDRSSVCLVPCMLPSGSRASLTLNGKERKKIPESPSIPCWTNLIMELPRGTGSAVLAIETENATVFAALKDLLIYE